MRFRGAFPSRDRVPSAGGGERGYFRWTGWVKAPLPAESATVTLVMAGVPGVTMAGGPVTVGVVVSCYRQERFLPRTVAAPSPYERSIGSLTPMKTLFSTRTLALLAGAMQ